MGDSRTVRKGTRWRGGAAAWTTLILATFGLPASVRGEDPASSRPKAPASQPAVEGARQGAVLDVAGRRVAVRLLDTLPYVRNAITDKFIWDRCGNPRLQQLRRQNGLDEVVAPGRDEFQRQMLLMDWAYRQIEYGDPTGKGGMQNALEILRQSQKEQKLFCTQFAALFVSAATSMGWSCRPISIPTHSFCEVWSNQHRQWILFDPTSNWIAQKDGRFLNVYEARKQWFETKNQGVSFLSGPHLRPVGGRSFGSYTTLFYYTSNRMLDERVGIGFRVKDQFGGGTPDSTTPPNPAVDLYFPINQASIALDAPVLVSPDDRAGAVVVSSLFLKAALRTLTPNFKTFRVRIDNGPWEDGNSTLIWHLHEGSNHLQAKSVNLFNVDGPVSTVEVEVLPKDAKAGAEDIVIPGAAVSADGNGQLVVRPRMGDYQPSYVHFWSTPGHWLEWTVQAPKEGLYDVWLTYSTRYRTSRAIRVNGETVKGLEGFSLAPTAGWTNWNQCVLPAQVPLKAGTNTVRMACQDEMSLSLAEIRLCLEGQKDLAIEAIRFTDQGGGAVQAVPSTEGGYFRSWAEKGSWFEWVVDVPEAGDYGLVVCYASMYPSPREVKVSGEVVKGLEKYAPPVTGGWANWVEGNMPAPVPLRKGGNVLRMTAVDGIGVNMCYLRLTRPGQADIRIDAVNYAAREGSKEATFWGPSRHASITHWYEKGQWVEWTIQAPKAGPYELLLRYASEAASPREWRLNGEVVKGLESFSPPPAGGTEMWKEFRLPATFDLKEGRNVLRVTNLGTRGLNVDDIRLRRLDMPS